MKPISLKQINLRYLISTVQHIRTHNLFFNKIIRNRHSHYCIATVINTQWSYGCKRVGGNLFKKQTMKIILIISFVLLIEISSTSQNMVSNSILQSVLYIKYRGKSGSSIAVTIDKEGYIVTARHIFPKSLKNNDTIEFEIMKDAKWLKYNATFLEHKNENVDIAVLRMKATEREENFFDIGSTDYYLSQECFFLGFPFGYKMEDKNGLNSGFPLPFVKKGIISAFITDTTNATQILLDGHNNPGFSGGPVVIVQLDPSKKNKMRVIGIISGYLNEKKTMKTKFGDLPYAENSGIVTSYSFDHVFEIIKRK